MADLYLIFFLVGIVLFGGIVAYSYLQQSRHRRSQQPRFDFSDQGESSSGASNVSPTPKKVHSTKTVADKIEAVAQGLQSSKDDELADREVTAAEPRAGLVSEPSIDQGGTLSTDTSQDSVDERPTNKAQTQAQTQAQPKPKRTAPRLGKAKQAIAALRKKAKAGSRPVNKEPTSSESLGSTGTRKSERDESQEASRGAVQADQETPQQAKVFTDANSVITDLVARVRNPAPIEQQGLLTLFREHDFKFHRKVHIYGLNELTDMWRDIEFELPSARFLELGVSIQLCDREGAMTEKELYDFQQMVLEFSNRYDAPFEFSMEIDHALQQAQGLDQIGRRYDSMAVLNVVPRSKSGFRIADIQSCARDLMMSTDKNGIFMKTEGQKNNITVLYRLACTDGDGHFGTPTGGHVGVAPVHDLVVYMNVPATRDPEAVFQQMVKDANDLSTWLDGKVVDRSGRAMTQRSYSMLMQQISDIAYSMQQDGLAPGDAVAKKLF